MQNPLLQSPCKLWTQVCVCVCVCVRDCVLNTNMASAMAMSPDPKCTQGSVVNSVLLTQPFFKQNVIP